MPAETNTIRLSLHSFVQSKYLSDALEKAEEFNLVLLTSSDRVRTKKDIKRALELLESTAENHEKVYQVCYESHEDRYCLSHCIDNWLRVQ
jgi:hypothetical protein